MTLEWPTEREHSRLQRHVRRTERSCETKDYSEPFIVARYYKPQGGHIGGDPKETYNKRM